MGVLSIDIDGNDYWVWDALDLVIPRIVIIETHIEFGYYYCSHPREEDQVIANIECVAGQYLR